MTAVTVEALLGGEGVLKRRPHSDLDWVAVVREGIAARALDAIASSLGLAPSEVAEHLGIAERTLARRRRSGTLTTEESAKLVRLARVTRRAAEVFEGHDTGVHWLKRPNRALGGERPLDLLDTEIGAENVLDLLGRIEHGVFS